ncbi:MAG: hypothetical protein MPW14_21990 [Candidatus Manganitrophus sp.]|nr:MAG: hypothetical protein MPW14_21990 [Candidatus Manganitrophus sp.]
MNKGVPQEPPKTTPVVSLFVGVNGVGKTTTIAKRAAQLRREGKTVLLAAADTFRAAAGEQLAIWGDRVGAEVVRHQEGADPAAVRLRCRERRPCAEDRYRFDRYRRPSPDEEQFDGRVKED